MTTPKIGSTPSSGDRIIHMAYDAVLDNSLWPEIISELLDYTDQARRNPDVREADIKGIARHFERALKISEATVSLQEQNATLSAVLDGLAVGVALYRENGELHYRNQLAENQAPNRLVTSDLPRHSPVSLVSSGQAAGTDLSTFSQVVGQNDGAGRLVVPIGVLDGVVLPPEVSWMLVMLPPLDSSAVRHIGRNYYLTAGETALTEALYRSGSVRQAAEASGITYETARTYLKRILAKTGAADQRALMVLLARNPASMLRNLGAGNGVEDGIRRELILPDGRVLEYFSVGPEDGQVILHFDALTGVAIDSIGRADIYLPVLRELGLRVVTPCRPGTFRSTFNKMSGLSQFTPDIIHLLDHLGVDEVSVLSQAFGASSALAFVATAGARVSSAVLCAPNFPRHEPENWRNMDVFYQISGVIGKRAPGLMVTIIPFLMRSVMQNAEKYLQRHIRQSRCQFDIDVLSSPQLHSRIPQNLRERVSSGNEGLVQENYLNTHGWDFDLSDIACPVAIIQGGKDNVSDPIGSRRLASLIPDARLHTMPDHGQYLMFTEWPWLMELCRERADMTDLSDRYFPHQLSPNGDIL